MRISLPARHSIVGCCSALITLIAAAVSGQAATVTVPPGLAPGSSYRLIYLTSGSRDGSSTNIADYNAFVTAEAAGVPALAALGTTWTAVASTSAVGAQDNTNTLPASGGVGIYTLNGLNVATNNTDLWDGSINTPITDSTGTVSSGRALSGTDAAGNHFSGPLGANGMDYASDVSSTTFTWISQATAGISQFTSYRMYAMSGVLVVPDYQVTTTGNAIVVTDVAGNGDTLTVSEPSAGNIKFAAPGRYFSVDGGAPVSGDSGDLSRASVTSITVNSQGGNDTINIGAFTDTLPSLTINGGTGNDAITFNGDITFAAGANLNADLFDDDASPGTDSVAVAAGANLIVSGAGNITIKGNGTVSMAAGASVETVNGAISLTSLAAGISLTGATVTTSGTGNVTVTGTGVGDGGGISISGGSVISSTGIGLAANQGLLTLLGSGSGFGTGLTLTGTSSVTSVEGAISITGFGNANASNRTSKGIVVDNSTVQSTGTATITLTGKGNSATFASDTNAQHHGIQVTGATALITSSAGKITLDGDARFGRSSNNFGVVVQNGAGVTGTGAAVVELIGITRIASGLGSNGNGIVVTDAGSRVTTVNGNLVLTGTGADQASSKGVVITTAGQVASTSGSITITGGYVAGGNGTGPGILYDSATAIATSGTINLVSGFGVGARMMLSNGSISGTTGVTVKAGAGLPIDLGSTTDTDSRADLSDAELDLITTSGTLSIGDANSGTITISAAITRGISTALALRSSSGIVFNAGSIDTAGGALTLTSGAAGSVQPLTFGTDVTTSAGASVAFGAGSKLGIAIAGAIEDTDYSPLNVVGKVDLTGVTLVLTGAYVPTTGSTGDSFLLVRNDGADAFTGTFTALPEGTNVTFNGVAKQITYVGGDGNDAVLVPAVLQVSSSTATLLANAPTLIINGFNFDPTPGNNTVVFNNGAVGTVTAATATQLTVTFTTQPTSSGSLTVVVTNGLGSSGASVQVATVSNIIATLSGGALTITDVANGNDTLLLSQSAGDLVITADASSVIRSNAGTGSGTNSVSIPLATITGLITLNAAGGTDTINIGAFSTALNGLTLNGGTGNDAVNLNGSITFAVNKSLDVDLQNDDASPGIDNVAVGINARIATSGTGTITVKVSQYINTAAGSHLSTASGDLTLEAAGDITTAGALVADAGNIVVLADSDGVGGGVFTSASPVPTLPTGAVLHYTMNEAPATNGVTLTDSSGSGNSSTVFRAAGDGAVAGKFGGALSFPGGTTTEYAITNPVSGAWPITAFTVSAWVKPSNAGYFFSYAVPGTDNEILCSTNDIWVNGNVVTITPSISPILSDGQFHHLAMTWDSAGGALVVYVDGVQKFAGTITPGSPITGGGSMVLGQDQDSLGGTFDAGQAFSGLMDEVAVFNRALSPAEVSALATPAAIRTGAGSVDLTAVDVDVNAAIISDGGLTVTNTGTASTISGVISGAGGLTKGGAGTLDLIAANTFAGDTTIDAGTVRLRSLIQNGSFESPALAAGDSVYYNFMTGAQQTAFGWTSTANPPYAAALQANSVAWAYQSAPNGVQAVSIQGNSTLSQSVNFPAPGNYRLAWKAAARAGQLQPCDVKLDGVTVYNWQTTNNAWIDFSTVISVPTAGAHTVTFVGLDPNQNMSVGIDAVTFGVSGSLPSTTAVTLTASGAVLDLNGISQTVGSIAGVSGTSITLGNGNLTTGGDGSSTEFAGVISGVGNFVKTGAGTSNLSGANTFTGTTTINAGSLRVNGSLADGLAATDVIVNSTGTLDGSGTINGVTQVNPGGAIAPGAGLGILNTKNVVLSSGATFSVQIGGATVGTGYDQLNANGAMNLGGATLSVASVGGFVPSAGQTYTIVSRTGGTGTFNGLAEGALVSANFLGSGLSARISYVGGTGDDVVLRLPAIIPVFLGASGSTGGGSGSGVIDAPNADATASLGKWETIRQGAVLSSNGHIAFRGHMELGTGSPPVTASNFQGIWRYDGTDTRLKARSGSTAPDSSNAFFDLLPLNPAISPSGLINFYGALRLGTGSSAVTASTNFGLWSEIGGGAVRLLLRKGDTIVPGKTFRSGFAVTASDVNTAALNAKLSSGSALLHLDVNTPTVQVTVVAEEGQSAPGGGTWIALDGNSSDPRLSANGDLGFIGWELDDGLYFQGIYSRLNTTAVGTSGAIVQARVGDIAPGTSNATFSAFERPTVFNGGMAFRGFLNLDGDNAGGTKGQGVWAGAFGSLLPVVRTGDTNAQIPTIPAGSTVTSVWSPFSNALGSITMRVGLANGGETRTIVGNTGGTMRVIAKVGDAAPGLAGETFTNFDHPVIGDGDQVAFTASTNTGSYGIWKQASGGGPLSLVVKVGDTINTSEGSKTVSEISLPGSTTDDRKFEARCMDATGRLLIHVTFSDGTTSLLLGQ